MGGLAEHLLQPPSPDELDDDGAFSKDACSKVEHMILADLGPKLKGFYMPGDPPKGTNPNNRWRTVSSMQKAIRFGDAEAAKFAASAGYDMDRKYLMRRLGICAIEDVGMGDMYGLLAVLAVMGNSAWRVAVDERRLFCFLAEHLANSPKDRSACEHLVAVDFNSSFDKEGMGKWTNEQLVEWIEDESKTIDERMLAAWLMAGNKKYWGETMPKENDRPARFLFSYMAKRGMSRASLYAAAKVASRLNEGMFVSLMFMDEWAQATKRMSILINDTSDRPKVGKLLGAAYDMHTREGRVAIGKFKKENAALLKPFLSHAKKDKEDLMLWFGLFCAEGGVLARRIVYKNSEELRAIAHRAELNYPGLPEPLHEPFLDCLKANIGKLNECRSKVLWASQAK